MIDLFKKYISVKNVIFFIITVLFLIFITKIKDIAILFFASYVISCSLNPLVDKLESKKISRSLASTVVLLSGLLILFAFVVPIIVMGGHQIKSFLHVLPGYIDYLKHSVLSFPYFRSMDITNFNISDVLSSMTGVTGNVVSSSITFSKEVLSWVVYLLAACIIIYYFLADKKNIRKGILKLFPDNMKKRADEIIDSISQKIGGYVVAQAVTMVSVGLIVLTGLLILRVDYALLLGLITAVFDIVPVVGPTLALIVIIIAVFKSGPLVLGLVIVIFAFAQWAENNLVRPYIFSKFMDLHPLIIYFFLFLTAQYLGLIGVVFAPAIAATVCVLIEELYIKTINEG